jgi:isoamyl acetate esterase
MEPFEVRLQVTLLGDSLTERSTEPSGWGAQLSHWYSRKADVIVRGYSGYNVRALQLLLRKQGGLPLMRADGKKSLVILWIGANDAAKKDICPEQHVPLSAYRDGVQSILKQFLDEGHVPVLMTPPAVDIDAWNSDCSGNARPLNSRSNETTGLYAAACMEVAEKLSVQVIDLVCVASCAAHFYFPNIQSSTR